jgi:hypothetical protein
MKNEKIICIRRNGIKTKKSSYCQYYKQSQCSSPANFLGSEDFFWLQEFGVIKYGEMSVTPKVSSVCKQAYTNSSVQQLSNIPNET